MIIFPIFFVHSSSQGLVKLTAGETFGGNHPAEVINAESAEIDDINVIQDGDHLFFLQNMQENMDCQVT